ncbi:MAG: type I restriction-modification system subunit M N-terminal domain-containing protein, partial [Kiritimatiellae bacterium]|nr:type I restriction-modification system subunit M N-terminal domain-containing protein [Kiritimatiellia bacterium]
MAKKEKKVKEERLEDILWACREHLRGMADMSDKRDVLLTLVFLKFMSDRFVEQQEKIRAKYADPKLAEIQMKKP